MREHHHRLVRILSINIHKGVRIWRLGNILNPLREAIIEVGADIVFLQEICGMGNQTSDQVQALAEGAWAYTAYGKNATWGERHHGNAIFSRFPIRSFRNIDLTVSSFERRGFLYARVGSGESGDRDLHLGCLHLDLRESQRRQQYRLIEEIVRSTFPPGRPAILAGDFNDWRGRAQRTMEARLGFSEVFRTISGTNLRTFPVWFPVLALDRIYTRNAEVDDGRCLFQGAWRILSDHAAVAAKLRVDFL